jgi:hypothetical protein
VTRDHNFKWHACLVHACLQEIAADRAAYWHFVATTTGQPPRRQMFEEMERAGVSTHEQASSLCACCHRHHHPWIEFDTCIVGTMVRTEHLHGRARHHDRATRKAAGARAGAGEGRWYCLATIALADSLRVRMGIFVPALRAREPPKVCFCVHVVLLCRPTTMVLARICRVLCMC